MKATKVLSNFCFIIFLLIPHFAFSGTFYLNQSADDAHENSITYIDNANYLYIGYRLSPGTYYSGFRFNDLNIPRYSTITSASIRLIHYNNRDEYTSLKIATHAHDNSPIFSDTNGPMTRRFHLSTNRIDWDWGPGEDGDIYVSPDISSIIQEIVDRSGWNSGYELSIIIYSDDTETTRRQVYAIDEDSSREAILNVQWDEPPTPVELSSFTAFYSNGTASLNWTTQSESNNQGWNVYRSETEIFSDAVQINSGLIEGAGTTSNPTDYNFTDEYYLEVNATYNYWLESKDESGAIETFGPIPLTIPENNGETPEPPNTDSGLLKLNNYPNPFYPDTEISFMLQEEGPVELSIFNVKGQKIATLFDGYVSENNLDQVQRVNWNGRDDSGKELTSGLYFYRINTSKGSFTNKMLLSR